MAYDELEEVLMSLDGVFDDDEPVDELSHALQCAGHAQRAGAAPALIAASLFHDVARSPLVSGDFPDLPHEVTAAEWLRPRLGEQVAWLAGAHVAAKVYLLAIEPGYAQRLSGASMRSAELQRASSIPSDHPWWPDALRLRRWDDAAKLPNARTPEPSELLGIVRALRIR